MPTFVATALILLIGGGGIALTLRMQRAEAKATAAGSRAPRQVQLAREPENAVERLVVFLKRRRAMRLVLSTLSASLLLGAAAMIGYPFYTNLYQRQLQDDLTDQLASPGIRQTYVTRTIEIGDALTRIKIPRVGLDTVVVEGTSASALRAGAGHYRNTPLPCEVGNVAIAGHRTTYGRPFHDLDLMQPGDPIILETPIGRCTYEVEKTFIVTPDQTEVLNNVPDRAMLTLTTCHPKGSARQRLILQATMVSAEPVNA